MVRSSIIIDQGSRDGWWKIPTRNKEYPTKFFDPLFVCLILISLSQTCLRLRSKKQIMWVSSSQRQIISCIQPCKWPPVALSYCAFYIFMSYYFQRLQYFLYKSRILVGLIRVHRKLSEMRKKLAEIFKYGNVSRVTQCIQYRNTNISVLKCYLWHFPFSISVLNSDDRYRT